MGIMRENLICIHTGSGNEENQASSSGTVVPWYLNRYSDGVNPVDSLKLRLKDVLLL